MHLPTSGMVGKGCLEEFLLPLLSFQMFHWNATKPKAMFSAPEPLG